MFDFLNKRYLPNPPIPIIPEVTAGQLIQARNQLLKLELEQCPDKAKRLQLYQAAIKDISDLETRAVARNEKFKDRQYDLFRLAGYHLDLEFAVEHEKMGKKTQAPRD
jgi:hypothetical protein